jgi:hypothetical protein
MAFASAVSFAIFLGFRPPSVGWLVNVARARKPYKMFRLSTYFRATSSFSLEPEPIPIHDGSF